MDTVVLDPNVVLPKVKKEKDPEVGRLTDLHFVLSAELVNNYSSITKEEYLLLNKKINEVRTRLGELIPSLND